MFGAVSSSMESFRGLRRLNFEALEDRRMLAQMADVVFLVDNSASDNFITKNWLQIVVTGDVNGNGFKDTGEINLSERLAAQGIDDVRYGALAYGELYRTDDTNRFAHSVVVDTDPSKPTFDRLFSSGATAQDHIDDLESAIEHLIQVEYGGEEDGWDAIDHAIAEYDFRPGAVAALVLVQNGEGRIDVNKTLTHDGVLAVLASKNVILNALVVDDGGPLFRLTPYEVNSGDFANIQILGVEPSISGNGQHEYHAFDTATNAITTNLPPTQSDTLQISFNGSNTGESGMVGSGKSILIGTNLSGGLGTTASGYEAKAAAFQNVDMSTGFTTISAGAAVSFPVTSGFDFFGTMYGGASQQQIFVNQDGTITFGTAYSSGDNIDFSYDVTSQNTPMLAALWDDLQLGTIRRKSVDVDQDGVLDLVIQWNGTRYVGDNTPGDSITFQAVLYATGLVQLNYADIDSFPGLDSGSPDGDTTVTATGGISATVGIWKGSADLTTLPAGLFVPGPHSIFGATLGEANDSYVRMAWDTGGAAWDIGVVQAFGIASESANALRDSFISSVSKQINNASALGRVSRSDDVLFAFNLGDGAITAEGFSTDPFSSSGITVLGSTEVDTRSNSIPQFGIPATKVVGVFRSARVPVSPPPPLPPVLDLSLSFTASQFPTLTDGRYIVELFFSEIASSSTEYTGRTFDVKIENKTVLNGYSIFHDHAKIVAVAGTPVTELDSDEAGRFTGIVKRFEVAVGSADSEAGLQIDLESDTQRAILNGIRILRAEAPRVENVVIKGTVSGASWAPGVDYSYAEIVAAGNQHRPIYLQNANRIEVHFDSPEDLSSAQVDIVGDNGAIVKSTGNSTVTLTGYNPTSFVGTWTLASSAVLGAGKYALHLSGVKGGGSLGIDGAWTNFDGPNSSSHSPDDFTSDKQVRLLSGNGGVGTNFDFHFAVLPGDYDQDGVVNATLDGAAVKDGSGDGLINSQDTAIATANNNTRLPLRANQGDYADNDLVDGADYSAWRSTFGNTVTPGTGADGSGNGTIDAADYSIWRPQVGAFSGWYHMAAGATAITIVDFGNAPKVTNVTISGSTSMHVPYSFDAHDGSGEQLRTVPVGGADTISITFNEDVNVAAENLRLVGLRTANLPTLVEFTYDIGTMTATWRFDDLVANDHYLLSLSDAVTDIEGNRLDGEWVNPAGLFTTNALVSEFPSGDGDAGGHFNFVVTLLLSDFNHDNYTEYGDYEIWSTNEGVSLGATHSNGDTDGDGDVDSEDDYRNLLDHYDVDLNDVWCLADLDGDFDVDADDVDIWDANQGMQNPTRADGDLNGDGSVNADDLDLMFAQYGMTFAAVS